MKLRQEFTGKTKRLVIKLGSLCVTDEKGRLRMGKVREIAQDISKLKTSGFEVVLVTSGAINAGKGKVTIKDEPDRNISLLQARAAIGQPLLMHAYQTVFKKYKISTAQVLLTHDDVKNSRRYLNLKNTLDTLLANHVLPIVNENDSVSFEEITLGDNDQLAAMVCELTGSDALVLLSESDGLYAEDPRLSKSEPLKFISFQSNFRDIPIFSKTSVGKGGMKTKLEAIKKLTPLGAAVILASFRATNPIARALATTAGSFFEPAQLKLASKRKARILARFRNHAAVHIDAGAMEALKKNASLLPVGIRRTEGTFQRGDVLAIKFHQEIVAYGISEFDSKQMSQITGLKTDDVKNILGFGASKVAVHKNNLILKND